MAMDAAGERDYLRPMRTRRLALILLAACGPSAGDTSTSTTASTTTTVGKPSTGETPTSADTPGSGSSATGASTGTTAASTGASTTGGEPGSSSSGALDPTTGGSSSGGNTTENGGLDCGGVEFLQLPEQQVEAGLEECPDQSAHRHTAVACTAPAPAEFCDIGIPCFDAPCDKLGPGLCAKYGGPYCRCAFPCTVDADCAEGAACLCHSGTMNNAISASECRPANCRTDADCGGFECGLSSTACSLPAGLFCRTAQDECKSGQECFDQKLGDSCTYDTMQKRWRCDFMLRCP